MSTAIDLIPPLTNGPTAHYEDSARPGFPVSSSSGPMTSVRFAFWSVTGALPDRHLGRDSAFVQTEPGLTLDVGTTDVHATAWYLPEGGSGSAVGVVIDAFDVNAGGFVDDNFVSVHPDDGLTFAANDDGFVPSASLEHVMAYLTLAASGRPLEAWIVVEGAEVVTNEDLTVAPGSSATAFAFYHSFPALPPRPVDTFPDGPVPPRIDWYDGRPGPMDPLISQFLAGLQIARIARGLTHELQAPVLKLAAKQITMSAQAIAEHLQKPLTPPPGMPPKG